MLSQCYRNVSLEIHNFDQYTNYLSIFLNQTLLHFQIIQLNDKRLGIFWKQEKEIMHLYAVSELFEFPHSYRISSINYKLDRVNVKFDSGTENSTVILTQENKQIIHIRFGDLVNKLYYCEF